MILAAVLVQILDPAIFLSPYNTTAKGEWIYPGAYLKTTFTGTSAALHFDTPGYQGAAPKFRWSVDGEPLRTGQATARLTLAEGLRPGGHSLVVYLAATDANYDRWSEPRQMVRLRALELDDGATVRRPRGLRKKRVVFFGDSITEGAWNLGDSYRVVEKKWVEWVKHSDATQAWPYYLARSLNAEYGVMGSGGMSWLRPSHSNIPPLPESWRFHYKGLAREWRERPDMVVVNMGTNDGERDTTAAAARWLGEVRREWPRARIVLLIPFGQQNKARLLAAAESGAEVIDLGPAFAEGLNKYGAGSAASFDGLHPNAVTSERLAEAVRSRISRRP
ncbi:MAG: hypothetical protein JNM66_01475 [Bryobacterales bacterium]|nr:hypothetical protein [Bryobacterales bacterium]